MSRASSGTAYRPFWWLRKPSETVRGRRRTRRRSAIVRRRCGRGEGNGDRDSGGLGGVLDGGSRAGEDDEGRRARPACRASARVERGSDAFECAQDFGEAVGVVGGPVSLGKRRMRAPHWRRRVCRRREVEADTQAVRRVETEAGGGDGGLVMRRRHHRSSGWSTGGSGSCQRVLRQGHLGAEVARGSGPMSRCVRFEPAGEGVGELVRVSEESGARSSRTRDRSAARDRW